MTKNRIAQMGFMTLITWLGMIISSCAPSTYNFIGNWTQKAGTFTYVNEHQHMKVTFPSDRWKVFTEPTTDYLKAAWTRPTEERRSYHVMLAELSEPGMTAQIEVDPVSEDLGLEDYLAIHRQRLETVRGVEILSSGQMECDNGPIGVTVVKGTPEVRGARGMKIITAIFKEKGRFTLLSFGCPESLFESEKEQFWAIVDSYEYID